MASSPVKFLFALLLFCGVGWIVFVFAARLLAWFLSRILGASVGFHVAGCNCLRDVTIKFKKGKKFKDKAQSQREAHGGVIPESDLNFSDSDGGQPGKADLVWPKRPNDGAGDGFVTSIRGLFNSQRRKAKAFVLRTMRGEGENEFHGEWSESDDEFSPFARQLTITKAKKLIRRHTC